MCVCVRVKSYFYDHLAIRNKKEDILISQMMRDIDVHPTEMMMMMMMMMTMMMMMMTTNSYY